MEKVIDDKTLKEKMKSWIHRFSDPKIPLGKHGASGIVIDNLEFDDFAKHVLG